MSFMDYFRRKQPTASVAKERLQIIVAHQRKQRNAPEWLPSLQADVLAAIRKYIAVDDNAIDFQMEEGDGCEVLELNVTLPENALVR